MPGEAFEWLALWGSTPYAPRAGVRYIVARPSDDGMPMAFATYQAGGWVGDDGRRLGFVPEWFADRPFDPPYPPLEFLPDGHPWKSTT